MDKKGKELTLSELKKVIDEIKEWGIEHISFAGGETLVRKDDVIKLIKYISSKNLRTDLITNGYFLNKKTCERLLKAGVSKISLSIDGAQRETNDKIRGKESYLKVIRAAKFLSGLKKKMKAKTELEFTTVILSYNFRELVDIFYLMKKLNFDYITYQVIVPDNSFTLDAENLKNFYKGKLWIKENKIKELEAVIEKLLELKRTGCIRNTRDYLKKIPEYFRLKDKFKPGKCIVGFSYLNIDPYGNVNVCGLGPNLNVKNGKLQELWNSREFKQTRALIKKCKMPCMMLCYDKLNFKEVFDAWMELRGWS
jgi:MoaA/NifB/PqqE/SkfB family radical SAM enzyme